MSLDRVWSYERETVRDDKTELMNLETATFAIAVSAWQPHTVVLK